MKNLRIIIFLIFSLSFLLPALAFSNDARVDEVKVDWNPAVKVSFLVKDAFTKDIEEAITSGVPTSFTFIVEFNRRRALWFDEHMGKWEFKHTVKYDSLKEDYVVSLDEAEKVIRTKDFNEMKKLMVTGDSIVISPAEPLKAGKEYECRIKAELQTIKLPFLLDYALFFVKFWDFETSWYTYRFTP